MKAIGRVPLTFFWSPATTRLNPCLASFKHGIQSRSFGRKTCKPELSAKSLQFDLPQSGQWHSNVPPA